MKLHSILFAIFLSFSGHLEAKSYPPISVEQIVAKYGKPDVIKSSEKENPRPPMVTKFVEYRKEGVRFTLLANAPVGTPPPYKSWLLLGYQDPKSNAVLSEGEAILRLEKRRR